jgi:hypothetical protein
MEDDERQRLLAVIERQAAEITLLKQTIGVGADDHGVDWTGPSGGSDAESG